MPKKLLIFPLLLCSLAAQAQFGNIWPVGKMQGIDFNGKEAKLIKTGLNNDSITINPYRPTTAHTSAISDCNGNILFYTNGLDIWNKKDTIMDNGRLKFSLGVGAFNRNCLIMPIPQKPNLYYVFYMVFQSIDKPFHNGNSFSMALVDLSYNGGLGKVVFKDSLIMPGIGVSCNLTFAKHSNNTDIWLIVPKNQTQLLSFKITNTGLNKTPVTSNVTTAFFRDAASGEFNHGFIKMNLDFTRLFVSGVHPNYNPNGHVLQYDFNRTTGSFSNEKTLVAQNEFKNELCLNLAISPNDSFLYITTEPWTGYTGNFFGRILQYNLYTNRKQFIRNFQRPIAYAKGSGPFGRYGMQTAPDGKIYVFLLNKIHRINFPNKRGIACNVAYWDSLQYLSYSSCGPFDSTEIDGGSNYKYGCISNDLLIFSLPNTYSPEYKLFFSASTDANPCTDTTTITYRGDSSFYKLVWYFGDGDSLVQTAPNIKTGMKIKHVYQQDGVYEVRLKSFHVVCNRMKEYADSITIKRNPQKIMWQTLPALHGCYTDTHSIAHQFLLANRHTIQWGDNTLDTIKINNGAINASKHSYSKIGVMPRLMVLTAANGCKITWRDTVKTAFNPKPIQKIIINGLATNLFNLKFKNKPLSKACEPFNLQVFDTAKLVKQIVVNWLPNDSTVSNIEVNKQLINTANSAYTFGTHAITTTNIFNCIGTDTFYTQIYAKPIANFALLKDSTCLKGNLVSVTHLSITKGNTDSLNFKFNWGDSTINQKLFHTYKTAGNKKIEMIIKGEFSCSDTLIKNIAIIAHPTANFIVAKPAQCFNQNIFTATTTNTTKNIIYWGDNSTSNLIDSARHSYQNTGTYSLLYIAENSFGCKDSIKRKTEVLPHPKAAFTLLDSSLCLNDDKVDFTSNTSFSNVDSVSSIVYYGDGWFYKHQNGNFNQIHTYTQAKNYDIKLVVQSTKGCLDSTQKIVNIFSNPDLNFGSWPTVCIGDSLPITNQWHSKSKINAIQWNTSNGFSGSSAVQLLDTVLVLKVKATQLGAFIFNLNATNIFGCKASITFTSLVVANPVANFDFLKTETDLDEIVYQFNDKSVGASKWNWQFLLHNQKSFENIQNPVYGFKDTGIGAVKLMVQNTYGCVDSITKPIIVYPSFNFYFPNGVSKNDDGLNETFGTLSPQFIKEYELIIFNRWGEIIFKTNDKTQQWQPTTAGVYVYKVYIRDLFLMQHNYRGTVTVVE